MHRLPTREFEVQRYVLAVPNGVIEQRTALRLLGGGPWPALEAACLFALLPFLLLPLIMRAASSDD